MLNNGNVRNKVKLVTYSEKENKIKGIHLIHNFAQSINNE